MFACFQGDPGDVISTNRFGAKGALGLPGLPGLPVGFKMFGLFFVFFPHQCFLDTVQRVYNVLKQNLLITN